MEDITRVHTVVHNIDKYLDANSMAALMAVDRRTHLDVAAMNPRLKKKFFDQIVGVSDPEIMSKWKLVVKDYGTPFRLRFKHAVEYADDPDGEKEDADVTKLMGLMRMRGYMRDGNGKIDYVVPGKNVVPGRWFAFGSIFARDVFTFKEADPNKSVAQVAEEFAMQCVPAESSERLTKMGNIIIADTMSKLIPKLPIFPHAIWFVTEHSTGFLFVSEHVEDTIELMIEAEAHETSSDSDMRNLIDDFMSNAVNRDIPMAGEDGHLNPEFFERWHEALTAAYISVDNDEWHLPLPTNRRRWFESYEDAFGWTEPTSDTMIVDLQY